MSTPGDAAASTPNEEPIEAAIDAEIVEVPTAPVAPTRADVTGYTDAGVPTFDHVRESIIKRTATALGHEELDAGSAAGQEAERRFEEHQRAAKARLDEIRKSMAPPPTPDA